MSDGGALVIGSDYGGLGIVRSLGRHGIPVWVLRENGHASATASRYARHCLGWPPDVQDEAGRVAHLLELADRHGLDGWVVYPTNDEAAALLARHAPVLGQRFRLTTPAWEAMRWAYDKRLTYALAARLGIDHPWTTVLPNAAAAAGLDCVFPLILKPAVKDLDNRFTQARAWKVDDRAQLIARYAEACGLVGPERVLVQELIQGGGAGQLSFVALCDHGRPVASAVARRLRQYPPDFGHGSSFVETLGDEPGVEAASRRLLEAIGYTGLVELEFKRDVHTGKVKLLDVNARAWAWHTLGRRAGVDFPYLAWQLACGQSVPETRGRAGVRWVRATTDLPVALTHIRRGGLSVGAYLHSLRPPLECAIFALDDPVPALFDIPTLLYRACRRGLARAGCRRAAELADHCDGTARTSSWPADPGDADSRSDQGAATGRG